MVLSDFSTKDGFAYLSYTYVIQRTIPSVRKIVTSTSPHHNKY